MKQIFLLLLILAARWTCAQPEVSQPKICMETRTIDFGYIDRGSPGVFDFEFKSCGTAPLIIAQCNTSCGCMVCDWPKDPFKPGQKGKLRIKYDTGRVGQINKTVTVRTNVEDESVFMIHVKGMVRSAPAIVFADSTLRFGMPVQKETRHFELRNTGMERYGREEEIRILRIEQVKGSPCALTPVSDRLRTGESTRLEFSVEKDKNGQFDKAWKVTFNDFREPVLLTATAE